MRIPPDVTVESLSREIDEQQAHLRKLLRAADPHAIITRPPSGDWSVMENVRHLLFVEQAHSRPLCAVTWSPLGLNSRLKPEMSAVGTATPKDIYEVLDEWSRIHRVTRRAIKGRDDREAREALFRISRHLRTHTRVIDRLLRRSDTH